MQNVLTKPALATEYLFGATPQWISRTSEWLRDKPTAVKLGAASTVGAVGYSACAAIALLLQLPCTLIQTYLQEPEKLNLFQRITKQANE